MTEPKDLEQSSDRRDGPSTRRRVAVLMVLSILLALIASSDRLHALLLHLFERVSQVIADRPITGAALFVVLSALSAMFVFLSSAVLVPAALLAWGQAITLVLLWLGWVLGAAMAYAVARRFGRPAVAWLMSRRALEAHERRIPHRAPVSLVFLFQLALPSEIVGYVLGLARYPFGRYLAGAALAELPYAFGVIFLGATMLERRIGPLLAIGAAGALLAIGALSLLRRRLSSSPDGVHPPGRLHRSDPDAESSAVGPPRR